MSTWGRVVSLALVVSSALALGCARKSVHAERVISAPAERIWAVLVDTSAYGEWNPILISAEGEFREGGTVAYEMKGPGEEINAVEPEVRKLVPERELNQFGGIPGVLTFDHTWRLEPLDAATMVTQHEEYRGLYVWFWDPSWVERAYEDALVALEERVAAEPR